jgi:nucleotide-binding universal stress UspA family protein
MLPIHTILHPTDFSEPSENAFHVACALARDYKAQLILLNVVVVPTAVYGEGIIPPPGPFDEEEELQERLQKLRPSDPSVSVSQVIAEGVPAAEILRVAREKHADLIVMGTHGRTGLRRLLMGSVAELVVRGADCPVLTVKMPFPESEPVAEPAAAAGATAEAPA